jgi:hypothetical protein
MLAQQERTFGAVGSEADPTGFHLDGVHPALAWLLPGLVEATSLSWPASYSEC